MDRATSNCFAFFFSQEIVSTSVWFQCVLMIVFEGDRSEIKIRNYSINLSLMHGASKETTSE